MLAGLKYRSKVSNKEMTRNEKKKKINRMVMLRSSNYPNNIKITETKRSKRGTHMFMPNNTDEVFCALNR